MAFGKAIGPKAFKLTEGAFGKCAIIMIGNHALDQLRSEMRDPASELERRHGAAQLIGLHRA